MNGIPEGVNRLYEYGGLVIALTLGLTACLFMIRYLLIRHEKISDTLVTVISDNTRVLTLLSEKIDELSRKD